MNAHGLEALRRAPFSKVSPLWGTTSYFPNTVHPQAAKRGDLCQSQILFCTWMITTSLTWTLATHGHLCAEALMSVLSSSSWNSMFFSKALTWTLGKSQEAVTKSLHHLWHSLQESWQKNILSLESPNPPHSHTSVYACQYPADLGRSTNLLSSCLSA